MIPRVQVEFTSLQKLEVILDSHSIRDWHHEMVVYQSINQSKLRTVYIYGVIKPEHIHSAKQSEDAEKARFVLVRV